MSRSHHGSVFVGIGKVWLEIPGCGSLKAKRSIIKPLLKKIRGKFQVSAAEIGHHDTHKYAVIGFAVLGNTSQDQLKYLGTIVDSISRNKNAKLLDFKTEIIIAGGVDLSPEFNLADDGAIRTLEEAWISRDEEGGT
ncbi:MAG: DUF503 domain-containing protein [Pseudomonadota bacterium]